jgi:hypothetical protein
MLGRLASDIDHGLTTDLAKDTVVGERNRPLDHQQVFALILLHYLLFDVLHLMAGSGIEGLVVIEGDEIKYQVFQGGLLGTQQGFTGACTLLAMKPDHWRTAFRIRHCLGHGHGGAGREPERGRDATAELEEGPSGDAQALLHS